MIGHFISYFRIPHVWSLAKHSFLRKIKFQKYVLLQGKDCSVLTLSTCAVDCKRLLLAAIKKESVFGSIRKCN